MPHLGAIGMSEQTTPNVSANAIHASSKVVWGDVMQSILNEVRKMIFCCTKVLRSGLCVDHVQSKGKAFITSAFKLGEQANRLRSESRQELHGDGALAPEPRLCQTSAPDRPDAVITLLNHSAAKSTSPWRSASGRLFRLWSTSGPGPDCWDPLSELLLAAACPEAGA